MIQFVKLYHPDKDKFIQNYFKEVDEGLSKPQKSLPHIYNYDEEGSKLCYIENLDPDYYVGNCEMEILEKQGLQILNFIGKEKFNLVELGAGDGKKTQFLIEAGMKAGYDMEYLPIDISHDSNLVLAENMKKHVPNLNMTIITSLFEGGVEWAFQNKKERNVFFFLGNTLGNNEYEEIINFFKWINNYLKKGDKFVFGIDMIKDPEIIQKAYFNDLNRQFIMNNLCRINKELKGNFNLQKFYPHTYFDPEKRQNLDYLISREKQTVNIYGKEYQFGEFEIIHTARSRKWTQEEIDKMAFECCNMKPVKHFEDSKKYFRLCMYEKL